MHETTPEIYLIAEPRINWSEVHAYLETVGGQSWATGIAQRTNGDYEGEVLTEFSGRLCYRAWEPGLNKNVTKVRTDAKEYFENILKQGHGSVLEHANYSFVFHNVSRVFTHELVRHRAGVAISQESLRYVRLTDIGFRIPPILECIRPQVVSIVERIEEVYRDAIEEFGLDDDGVPFHLKKEVTSALRRIAPLGLSTGMIWTGNIRTLRHVIYMRTNEHAEEEIRRIFHMVASIMKDRLPLLFQDFVETPVEGSNIPAWIPTYPKV